MKPGTFTQIYIQLVFSPMNRQCLLQKNIRPRVFEYISGIITNLGHKSIIVNGIADHVHLFIGMNPNLSVSDTVKEIKRASSLFINENRLTPGKFQWQHGYGGFSYSRSHIEKVYDYILNQEEHHKKKTFREEYLDFLKKYEISFEDQYLFEFFE
ncbi:IS200/IS605 family transposase [Gaoshiqia sediminis]|uniref:IS200/IS605 family transposase n=1 Tax=Gaoshiqia sediminis TaxID=2986998 RepID=A0AA41YEW7_9BACT|nr:IS200/IS605 family transposase [Gaoshiqia sediminis]MCW0484752.1 IS200/IS605 family transposase [Gaoshiqia sediminis]